MEPGLVWLNIVILIVGVHAQSCQPGQERFGDSCYQLLTEKMTWEQAAETCSDMGGSLAVPDSPEEHQFIWEMFTRNVPEGDVWIGCSDMEEEGKYIQPGDEGSQCGYFNWAPDEPHKDYEAAEDCLHMRAQDGLWNDLGCDQTYHVICEHPVVPVTTPVMTCLKADAAGRFAEWARP